jgi:ketosteroid isomerase-like protein
MAANTPEQLHQLFAARFCAGDLDGLLDLYEDAAVLVTLNGACTGREAIRPEIQALLGMGLPIRMETRVSTCAGNLALLSCQWTIEGVGTGHTAEVARQSADGFWRFIIDHPWGL